MGLSASQARFLSLTSQLSSVQRQGQFINGQRSALAQEMNKLTSGNNQSAALNPFMAGGGDSPEYAGNKNSKSNKNNNSSKSTDSFSSLISSLTSAATQQCPGENKCSSSQVDSSKLAAIQAEDSKLERLLRVLDTKEQCMKTEIEAVQKVIDKNVEGSFKLLA